MSVADRKSARQEMRNICGENLVNLFVYIGCYLRKGLFELDGRGKKNKQVKPGCGAQQSRVGLVFVHRSPEQASHTRRRA